MKDHSSVFGVKEFEGSEGRVQLKIMQDENWGVFWWAGSAFLFSGIIENRGFGEPNSELYARALTVRGGRDGRA